MPTNEIWNSMALWKINKSPAEKTMQGVSQLCGIFPVVGHVWVNAAAYGVRKLLPTGEENIRAKTSSKRDADQVSRPERLSISLERFDDFKASHSTWSSRFLLCDFLDIAIQAAVFDHLAQLFGLQVTDQSNVYGIPNWRGIAVSYRAQRGDAVPLQMEVLKSRSGRTKRWVRQNHGVRKRWDQITSNQIDGAIDRQMSSRSRTKIWL